jgi:hypothetical protein
LKTWLDDRRAAAAAEPDLMKRYFLWRAAWDDPRMPLLGSDGEDRLRELIPPFARRSAHPGGALRGGRTGSVADRGFKVRRLDDLRAERDGLARRVCPVSRHAGRTHCGPGLDG